MATITRTFGTTLTSTYVPVANINPTIEVLQLRDMVFDADERLAIYLDTAQAVIDIGSFNIAKIPNLDGDESTVEEALALSKAESESNKIGLRILTRKNNTGVWQEIAEFILLNYGRKDYLDLRTKTGFPARLLEKDDALAVQLMDYGDGLLWDTDTITVSFALSIEIEKKNNLEAFEARISAIELAVQDRLINLPAGTLLGRNETTGTVQQLPQSQFATSTSPIFTGNIQFGYYTGNFSNASLTAGMGTFGEDAVFALHCSGSGLGVFGFDFSANRFVIGANGGKPIDFCTNIGGGIGADNLAPATPTMRIIGGNIVMYDLPTSSAGLISGMLWRDGDVLSVA